MLANRDHLLWFFRTMLSRNGLGKWADMPKPLQKYVSDRMAGIMNDTAWVDQQLEQLITFDRTWAAAPALRVLICRAGFKCMCDAAANPSEIK